MSHSKSMEDLRHYRDIQEEYKRMEWFKEPIEKVRTRGRVRHAKRSLQSSSSEEERHLHDLETYSRANSSRGSSINSRANSDSGLDLEERFSRPYRGVRLLLQV
ncbi:hypothetical protein BYT27DRAFT_6547352 [Phlegmacium glaucopus]|nr:hypothetical protein BYT27DRAFT_6765357 [Phlegmacium glaucopus]KAF8808568.1 hypothetical protein BYT27DRAFT_6547352 [Phlegmacium glaucopus]